jgi:DNA-binding PadR family transcriptional regulator
MILGLVKWLQPVHGYDVRRELMSWQVDRWANIQPGSIYHALRRMTEEGLLAEVATEQIGARPARTTYRMTPAGDREFEELLREYWWEHKDGVDPFAAAFSLLPALPRREAVAALRNRARLLEGWIAQTRHVLEAARPECADEKPVHVTWIFELGTARAEVEIAWCLRIADRIEAGEGSHVSDLSAQTSNNQA